MKLPVKVYKGERIADTYLYVAISDDLERVPEALKDKMGELSLVIEIDLEPGRRLARVEGKVVLDAIDELGYYLQLPPLRSNAGKDSLHERLRK
ncbi:MAG: YcgL domain-containing protein [Pseudomonadales bacterium]|nr:YcgL domain-containing protein [Pseudomonadales bacterium]